jgi:hypothetical protein
MAGHFDPEDIEALLSRGRKASRASASDRRAAERRSFVSPNDGRKRKRRGPTAQVNVEVRTEIKDLISRIAHAHGLSYIEIVEQAVELFAKHLEEGTGNAT